MQTRPCNLKANQKLENIPSDTSIGATMVSFLLTRSFRAARLVRYTSASIICKVKLKLTQKLIIEQILISLFYSCTNQHIISPNLFSKPNSFSSQLNDMFEMLNIPVLGYLFPIQMVIGRIHEEYSMVWCAIDFSPVSKNFNTIIFIQVAVYPLNIKKIF